MQKVFYGLLASALLISTALAGQSTTFPPLETFSATASVSANRLSKGHVYILTQSDGLRVIQNLNNGLLLQVLYGYSETRNIFLETTKRLADESYFRGTQTCVVYKGLIQYQNVHGSTSTVHSFKEVSCSPYLASIKARNQHHQSPKPVNQAVKNSNPEKSEEEQRLARGEWVTIPNNFKNIQVRTIRPDEVPIDLNRWVLFQKDTEGDSYFDRTTVEKRLLSSTHTAGTPHPIEYTIWLKFIIQAQSEKLVSTPIKMAINCLGKTVEDKEVSPESFREKLYKSFCFSPDAEATYYPGNAEIREAARQDQERTRQINDMVNAQQRRSMINQGIQAVQTLIPLRRY